ncbi:MAG: radical SAM protein [Endomicrobiaceae bacterium]|nr:radical SAM protein [Endomicrobiaceae bacterium]
MKIVLVRIHHHSLQLVPPLGLGYISAYLNQHGIETIIVDGLHDCLNNEEILAIIKKETPDAVGIGCLTAEYNVVINLSNLIKKTGIKVIIGGIHSTALPYSTLIDSKADFVICGEGEIAFTKLALNNFVNNNIKGIYSLENLKSENDILEYAEQTDNLDIFPFPSWEKFPPDTYNKRPAGLIYKKMPIGYIMTSRGCAYSCTFCSGLYAKKKVRFRSIENVVSEIKELVNKYGVKEIKFIDDNLAFKKEHIMKLCNALTENDIKIPWGCTSGLRANCLDEEIIAAMKKAGCYYFNLGIESVNDKILSAVNKQQTTEQVSKIIDLAYKYDIICGGFFIFGLPEETKKDIKDSVDFAVKSKLSLAIFSILDIFPGSQLWKDANYKFDRNNIEDSFAQPRYLLGKVSKKDLVIAQRRALLSFYLRPRVFFRLLRFIKKEPVMSFFERLFKKVKIN